MMIRFVMHKGKHMSPKPIRWIHFYRKSSWWNELIDITNGKTNETKQKTIEI